MNDSLDFVQHCFTAIGYFKDDLLCHSATQKRTLQKGMVQNPEGYSVTCRSFGIECMAGQAEMLNRAQLEPKRSSGLYRYFLPPVVVKQ